MLENTRTSNWIRHLLPYDKLFYLVDKKAGPPKLEIDGKCYVRYMDRIYIPNKPSELRESEVKSLASLRLALGGEIIDNYYTQGVLSLLYEQVTKLCPEQGVIRFLDFGCGDGNIVPYLNSIAPDRRPNELVGIDISEDAITLAQVRFKSYRDGSASLIKKNDRFDLKSSYFCAAIANFVFHFQIAKKQARELNRVLKPGGVLAYNDYLFKRDAGHFRKTKQMMFECGFKVWTETLDTWVAYGSASTKRPVMIVVCQKQ